MQVYTVLYGEKNEKKQDIKAVQKYQHSMDKKSKWLKCKILKGRFHSALQHIWWLAGSLTSRREVLNDNNIRKTNSKKQLG